MDNPTCLPLLSEMDNEEGKILHDMMNLLNYVLVAPTLNRAELATKLMGVTTKFLETLHNHKPEIQSLGKQPTEDNEQLENAKESVSFEHLEEDGWIERPDDEIWSEHQEVNGMAGFGAAASLWSEHQEVNGMAGFGAAASLWSEHQEVNGMAGFGAAANLWLEDGKDLDRAIKRKVEDRLERVKNFAETIRTSTSEYVVLAILGSGTFGTVLHCVKTPSNETVALKVIKDNFHQKEVEVLQTLTYFGAEKFNIVSSMNSFTYKGLLCLEFKKLDISLIDYITSQGSLQPKEIRPILQQIAVALTFLNDIKIIHTDLKPQNLMLVDRSQQPLKLQVIDFGEAMLDPEKWVGATFQTLWYRAPEVVLGSLCGSAIDMWSSGCIAAEMLMGEVLFPVRSEFQLLERIISVLGQPPDKLLKAALYTDKYFFERSPGSPTQGWYFESADKETGRPPGPNTTLQDLLKVANAVPEEDEEAVECDRLCFVDLVSKMLHMDASQRITPMEILCHPFITMSHLNRQSYSSYVNSSVECMKVCSYWRKEENTLEQNISTTPNFWNAEDAWMLEEPPRNSEEETSVPDVFIREEGSPEERPQEDLSVSESVNRWPGQNEDKSWCTTPDCPSSAREKRKKSVADEHVERSSVQHVQVCSSCGIDGEEKVAPSPSNTTDSDRNHPTMKDPPCVQSFDHRVSRLIAMMKERDKKIEDLLEKGECFLQRLKTTGATSARPGRAPASPQ